MIHIKIVSAWNKHQTQNEERERDRNVAQASDDQMMLSES